jgi:hypothetical protein
VLDDLVLLLLRGVWLGRAGPATVCLGAHPFLPSLAVFIPLPLS